MDTIQNINADGLINPDYYKNAINDICQRSIDELYPDTKITNNHMLAIMDCIYSSLFKPTHNLPNNQKCNIPYNTYNLTTLLNIYIELYNKYLCLPSMYSFSCMTGIDEPIINQYVTAARFKLSNNRRDKVQGKLYNSPLGVTVLANNDIDTGLMYNRQNMIDNQTVKQGLTVNDFVKISQQDN